MIALKSVRVNGAARIWQLKQIPFSLFLGFIINTSHDLFWLLHRIKFFSAVPALFVTERRRNSRDSAVCPKVSASALWTNQPATSSY
jgi:hypothetical protein